jgi:hypothetical protein
MDAESAAFAAPMKRVVDETAGKNLLGEIVAATAGPCGANDGSGDDSRRLDARAILSVIVPAVGMSTTGLKTLEADVEQSAATSRERDRQGSGPNLKSGFDGAVVGAHWANQVYISSSGSSSMSGSGELGEKTSDMREGAPSLETPPGEGQSCSNSSSSRDGPELTGSSSDLRPTGVLQSNANVSQSHIRHPIVGPAVLLLCDSCGAMPAVVYCTGQTRCYCEECAKREHAAELAVAAQQGVLSDWRMRTAKAAQASYAEKKTTQGNDDNAYPSNRSRSGDSGDSASGERDPTSESPSGGDQGTSNSGNGGSGDPTSSSPAETAASAEPATAQLTKISGEGAHRASKALPGHHLPKSVAMMMLLGSFGEHRSSASEEMSIGGEEFASAESVSDDADEESTSFGHESARSGELREEPGIFPAPMEPGSHTRWMPALSDEDLAAAAEKAVRELASANGNGSRSADSRHASSNDLPSTVDPVAGTSCVAGISTAQPPAPSNATTARRASSLNLDLPLCCIDITATDARTAITVAKSKPLIVAQRSQFDVSRASVRPQPVAESSKRSTFQVKDGMSGALATGTQPAEHRSGESPIRTRRRRTALEKDVRNELTAVGAVRSARVSQTSNAPAQSTKQGTSSGANALAQAEAELVARASTTLRHAASQRPDAGHSSEAILSSKSPFRSYAMQGGQWASAATTGMQPVSEKTTIPPTRRIPWFERDVQQAPSLSRPITSNYSSTWPSQTSHPSLADFVEAPLEQRRTLHACVPSKGLTTASAAAHAREHFPEMNKTDDAVMHAAGAPAPFLEGDETWSSHRRSSKDDQAVIPVLAGMEDALDTSLPITPGRPAARIADASAVIPGKQGVADAELERTKYVAPAITPAMPSVAWMHATPPQQARCPTVSGLSRRRAESARAKVDRWLLGAAGETAPRRMRSPTRTSRTPDMDADANAGASAEATATMLKQTAAPHPAVIDADEAPCQDIYAPDLSTGAMRVAARQGDICMDEFIPGLAVSSTELPGHDLSKYATPLPHGLVSRSTPSSGSGAGDTSSTGGDLEPSPLAAVRTLRAEHNFGEFRRMQASRRHKSPKSALPRMTAAWSAEVKSAAQRRYDPPRSSNADEEHSMRDETHES